METKMTEQTAKAWSKGTSRINEARAGEIAVAWADEQGNKHVGYVDLFKLKVTQNGRDWGFGDFLESLVKADKDIYEYLGNQQNEITLLRHEITLAESKFAEQTELLNKSLQKLNELWAWVFPDQPIGL